MTIAYLGLGANLGNSKNTLMKVIECLEKQPNICLLRKSSFYISSPIDAPGKDYTNCVVSISTILECKTLLDLCLDIECQFGRKRLQKHIYNAPRTIDIDLLLFGNLCINNVNLTIPHPRLVKRAFVILPLIELEKNILIPEYGKVINYVPFVNNQNIKKLIF